MKTIRPILIPLLILLANPSGNLSAADPARIIDLWPGDIPGPLSKTDGEERDLTKPEDKLIADKPIIKLGHVAKPQAHVFLPPAEKANGTAVVICPGGGFSILAWDLEGTEVAEWLNGIGIAAVVVKYRVPTREHGDESTAAPGAPSLTSPAKTLGPLMDAQRALSLIRAHASEWQLDPGKIGVMGFSAGGETAALAALSIGKRAYPSVDASDEASCTANFALLIYPGGLADPKDGVLKPDFRPSPEAPPMFFVHAADDRVTCLSSTALFQALRLAGVPAELHIFAGGGHGYGLRPTEFPVTRWPVLAEKWLADQGLTGAK